MRYEYIRAEQFCDSVRDGTHDTPKPTENGYKLVTGKHIRDGRVDHTEAYYISEKDYNKINERSRVDQWDVLMSMIGNGLGRSAIVYDNPNYAIKNIALFKVRDEIKAKWLHYYLSGSEGQGRIYNYLQGSGQPFISLTYLRDFPVPNPPRGLMSTIVGVLEKYDSLIDNNQKQIKLLEEAAQRLYREWFIDLRFPGHESTPVVDGIPVGWQKVAVTDLLEIKYGKDHKSLPDGNVPAYGSGGIMRKVASILRSGESVLIPRKGSLNNIMYVSGDFWTIDTMFYSVPRMPNIVKYTYLYLRDLDMYSFNIGAAVPSMTVKILEGISLLKPSENVLTLFEGNLSPLFARKEALKKQIETAGDIRDSLLSKLMTGEIVL